MPRFPFRTVLFALALAFQAVAAGGYSLAGMASPGHTVQSAHCERDHASAGDHRLPADNGRHKHDCLSCQMCASGASPFQGRLTEVYQTAFRESARVGFAAAPSLLAPSLIAQSHRARAPPTLS